MSAEQLMLDQTNIAKLSVPLPLKSGMQSAAGRADSLTADVLAQMHEYFFT
jgi:hypothetical protein